MVGQVSTYLSVESIRRGESGSEDLRDAALDLLKEVVVEKARHGSIYVKPRDVERLARRKGFDEYTAWRIATVVGKVLSRFCPRVRSARPALYRISTNLLCALFNVCSYEGLRNRKVLTPVEELYIKIALLYEATPLEVLR